MSITLKEALDKIERLEDEVARLQEEIHRLMHRHRDLEREWLERRKP